MDKPQPFRLPEPGEVVHIDVRASNQQAQAAQPSHSSRPLRLVQWNIERGYQLPLVIKHLQDLDADVISLQEVSQCFRCIRMVLARSGVTVRKELSSASNRHSELDIL
jgi:hypothetical protein